ncbi:MAG: methyl-accepting chemotaxis protein, partial [Phycisphaerae bacterium]|nr:methyl-accepting chemotaxis protein [Phycisphaerae bacterium]
LLMLAKQIIEVGRNGAEAAATSADQAAQKGLRLQAICLLGVLVAGALTSFLIVRAVTGPLNRIATTLDKSARQVAEASGHVNSAAQSLAEGASAQVASLEETSSTLEQTASMVRQTSDNTAKGNESMQETGRLVAGGSEMVGRMSKAMSEITDSATQIGRIIKTIEEIAFQTNLLALNAAVEAARAGEAGKGFAVVADEVRNLAQRSAQAARDTSQLIENTVTRVRNGSEIVGQLTESYKTIEGSSGNVAQLIHEIKMATSEQAQGVDQVNHALTQIDQVTQQNAASAEECASASKELSAQAEAMRGMVDNLMAVISGERTTTTQGRSVPRLRSSRPVKSLARYVPTSETQKVMKSNDVISLDDDISDCKDF